jgi:transposase InsO family protein
MRLQALKARPRRRRLPPDLGKRQATAVAANLLDRTFEASAPNRSGEREPGTFHYNPGNMSGKTNRQR